MGIFREIAGLVSQTVWENSVFSVEQTNGPSGTQFYVTYWRNNELVRVFLGEFHLGRHFPDGEINALSNVLSLFSGSCHPLCLPGASATVSSMVDSVYPNGPTRILGLFFTHEALTSMIDDLAIPFVIPVGVHALLNYILLRIRAVMPCHWLNEFPALEAVSSLSRCGVTQCLTFLFLFIFIFLFPGSDLSFVR